MRILLLILALAVSVGAQTNNIPDLSTAQYPVTTPLAYVGNSPRIANNRLTQDNVNHLGWTYYSTHSFGQKHGIKYVIKAADALAQIFGMVRYNTVDSSGYAVTGAGDGSLKLYKMAHGDKGSAISTQWPDPNWAVGDTIHVKASNDTVFVYRNSSIAITYKDVSSPYTNGQPAFNNQVYSTGDSISYINFIDYTLRDILYSANIVDSTCRTSSTITPTINNSPDSAIVSPSLPTGYSFTKTGATMGRVTGGNILSSTQAVTTYKAITYKSGSKSDSTTFSITVNTGKNVAVISHTLGGIVTKE
jgi:hypothetical protein